MQTRAGRIPSPPRIVEAGVAKKTSSLGTILLVAVVAVAAYFINVEVQTHLGESALAATGLEALPLDQALQKAAAEKKLVLANLSAIWCPTCRSLDKTVFADAAVKSAIADRFVFARVEYESDEGKAFQERYKTKGFPNLLLLSPSGELVKALPVTTDPAAFLKSATL